MNGLEIAAVAAEAVGSVFGIGSAVLAWLVLGWLIDRAAGKV
jgi:hypothetical protein